MRTRANVMWRFAALFAVVLLAGCGGSSGASPQKGAVAPSGSIAPSAPIGSVVFKDEKGRYTVNIDPAWKAEWDHPGTTGLMAWDAFGTGAHIGSVEANSPQLDVFRKGEPTDLAAFTTWYAGFWQDQGCTTDSTGTVPGLHSAALGVIECHGTVLGQADTALTVVFDLGPRSVAVAEVFTTQAAHAAARATAMPYLVTIKDYDAAARKAY